MTQHGFGAAFVLVFLGIVVLMIASVWNVFAKADEPGWASLVPIYNTYVLLKIGGNPGWYLLLLFVPMLNFLIAIKACIDVARAFGLGLGWGLGLAFFPYVFFPLLGFGDYVYRGVPGGEDGGSEPGERAAV